MRELGGDGPDLLVRRVAATSVPTPTTKTVWLCRPGLPNDACDAGLATTVVGAGAVRAPPGSRSTHSGGSSDPRPVVSDVLGPTWGLHLVDVNLTLGSLVSNARQQAAAFEATRRK